MKIQSGFRVTLAAASLLCMTAIPAAFAQTAPEVVTNGPQFSPGDGSGHGPDLRNVSDSERYEQTLRANAAFREQRMLKECSSIDDQKLHEQCVASFH